MPVDAHAGMAPGGGRGPTGASRSPSKPATKANEKGARRRPFVEPLSVRLEQVAHAKGKLLEVEADGQAAVGVTLSVAGVQVGAPRQVSRAAERPDVVIGVEVAGSARAVVILAVSIRHLPGGDDREGADLPAAAQQVGVAVEWPRSGRQHGERAQAAGAVASFVEEPPATIVRKTSSMASAKDRARLARNLRYMNVGMNRLLAACTTPVMPVEPSSARWTVPCARRVRSCRSLRISSSTSLGGATTST